MGKYILIIIAAAMVITFGVISGGEGNTAVPAVSPVASIEPQAPRVLVGDQFFKVDIADESAERYQGLSGREKLNEGSGMLFIFEKPDLYGFWMKDMRFPIDIVWIKGLDKRRSVLGISEDLQPASFPKLFYPPKPVNYVLEIPVGEAAARGLKVGDEVRFLLESEAQSQ